jgi:hypothetical protein
MIFSVPEFWSDLGIRQVDFLTSRAPEHVMAAKWSDKSKDNFPGPGSYNTTPSHRYKKGTPPSYSMGGRWPDLAAKAKTPSPLAYDVKPGIKVGSRIRRITKVTPSAPML